MLPLERNHMICTDIISIIEHTYPTEAALEWDNVGLQVGRYSKDVSTIYIALDLTDAVIEDAILEGADMIITHHPMIFSPIKSVTDGDLIGKRLIRLLQNDICYYAMHTNYDALGMAELASEKLGLCDASVLEEIVLEGEGIGRVGNLKKEMSLEDCCKLVKTTFDIPDVKLYGDRNQMVQRIAISPGSGKSMIRHALEKNAQVLIAGDFDHHSCLDAMDNGLAIIDAGHYGTEYMFVEDIASFIREKFIGIATVVAPVHFPFETI